jgi:hypothetical protein
MKDRPQRVNESPEGKHDDSTKCDSVVYLMARIEGLYHGDIEGAQHRNTVNGEMRRRDEEA